VAFLRPNDQRIYLTGQFAPVRVQLVPPPWLERRAKGGGAGIYPNANSVVGPMAVRP